MIRTALLVAAKDLRIERRSRVLLWQVVPFGVMALLLSGLALGPTRAGHSSAALYERSPAISSGANAGRHSTGSSVAETTAPLVRAP